MGRMVVDRGCMSIFQPTYEQCVLGSHEASKLSVAVRIIPPPSQLVHTKILPIYLPVVRNHLPRPTDENFSAS